ncbi:MAG: hypothetical protein JWQ66_372 [Mucilaginibacter sp.]|nr:hypothetical protein [Mucilaginibacter sp.]
MAVKWHEVYHELAVRLNQFYKENSSNPARSFADLCLTNDTIRDKNSWITRAIDNLNDYGIDPIQIFANLSEPHAGTKLRTERLRAFLAILGLADKEEIDFTGCPTLLTIKVTARRPTAVQNAIWLLLSEVTDKGQVALTSATFDNLKAWYGINITSLTVFLFWIDAEHFLPMDQNTVRYVQQRGWAKARPKNFLDYQAILHHPEISDYPNISIYAKDSSPLKSKEPPAPPPNRKTRSKNKANQEALETSQIDGCRLLAIRVYNETDERWRKVLRKNGRIYSFYRAFKFRETISKFRESNDSEIAYDPLKDVPLYQEGKLSVHVSAIVGENGSGKSTLTELIFLTINNFTKAYSSIPNGLIETDGLFVDLFFITDALYKLSVQGNLYLLKRYERIGNTFRYKEDITLLDFDFEQFFYSVVTNYALYALNSKHMGPWVKQLFHKNDQYQVPINISPFRKEGNIDINKENGLVKTRLLSNLLLPVDKAKRKIDTIRTLTATKMVEKLHFKLMPKKFDVLYEFPENIEHYFSEASPYWFTVLSDIKKSFNIVQEVPAAVLQKPNNYEEACWMYLMKKVISICMTYKDFNIFFEADKNEFDLTKLDDLMGELHRQKSHVTHKFYQAIHFFNDDHLKKLRNTSDLKKNVEYELNDLADMIQDLVVNRQDKQIKTIHFVPPAFLEATIILTGGTDFNNLSSGEKQRIYSVSSVVYHLLNIDSNADQEELIRYSAANIIFDEVELYFHPEMQRSFIKYLLDYLNRLELEVITSVNIMFITHSPFILSDIPADNIIFLGNTEPNIKTFAANIHTMLAESFFLKDSFMGEYARETVSDLIKFLINEDPVRKWDVHNAAAVINAIGEPLLKNRLLDIYAKKFESSRLLEDKINAVRYQLQTLENETNTKR